MGFGLSGFAFLVVVEILGLGFFVCNGAQVCCVWVAGLIFD